MSYLVLARKWRPKRFEEVVGQDHVVRTLAHALDNERLHHAYLFTGTRGVGKTTLARILAKALNCQRGVSSKPCNQCNTCMEIDEGRFIDLIEVDAASKTKVEDTRTLLESVPYRATSGRYKVYLIDEIHMLSGHSFNALLKTLEEPPEHVKFLMATTDPQKLPVTVLSRCIQFNLRAMDTDEISSQLEKILQQENIEFEPAALSGIARQSRGSMRDGLSILDQAISYTHGNLLEAPVREMLGMISQEYLQSLLTALANQQADTVLSTIENMCERSVNFESALDEMLLKLHDLSLLKIAPSVVKAKEHDIKDLLELDPLLSAEEIQLYYQIGLIGKRDLALAPEPRIGFEMVLMRMLAFHPQSQAVKPSVEVPPAHPVAAAHASTASPTAAASATPPRVQAARAQQSEPPATAASELVAQTQSSSALFKDIETSEDWLEFARNSDKLNGPVGLFARKLSFQNRSGNTIILVAPEDAPASMMRAQNPDNLKKILRESFGTDIELIVRTATSSNDSLEKRLNQEHEDRITEATKQIEQEEIPRILHEEFNARIEEGSVRPAAIKVDQPMNEGIK